MNRSKSLLVILLGAALMALIFTSCGKDDGSSSNGGSTHELVGTWNLTAITVDGTPYSGTGTVTFNSSKTFSMSVTIEGTEHVTENGTWTTTGKNINFTLASGEVATIPYTLSGTNLSFEVEMELSDGNLWDLGLTLSKS